MPQTAERRRKNLDGRVDKLLVEAQNLVPEGSHLLKQMFHPSGLTDKCSNISRVYWKYWELLSRVGAPLSSTRLSSWDLLTD